MIDFHQRFERVIGVPKPLNSSQRLFSLKMESGLAGFEAQRFYDAIYTNEDEIVCVPFVMIEEDDVIFPSAARALSEEALARVSFDVRRFARSVDEKRGLRVLGKDKDLQWLLDSASGPAMLGLSSYEQFFLLLESYEVSIVRAIGRRVLDECAGLGDGALLFKSVASAVDAVTPDERLRRIARRIGRDFLLERPPDRTDYGLAVRFNVDATQAADAVESVRARSPHGIAVLTSSGERGRIALEAFGAPRTLLRVGFESAGPTGDWELVLGPPEPLPAPDAAQETHSVSVGDAPLSVLLLLRPSAQAAFGGDVIQVIQTAEALRRRGNRVVVSLEERPDTSGFDIVHLTNLTSTLETLVQARAVRSFQGPIALMPIFLDHADETIWGMETHAACFVQALGNKQLDGYLDRLEQRGLTAGNRPQPPARSDPFEGYTLCQQEIVESCDFMIANAFAEVNRVFRYLDCKLPFAFAASATDASIYGPAARKAFVDKYGLQDFVLCTGRIEARKNQLLLMQALRDLDLKVVLVGRNDAFQYGGLVRAFRAPNAFVLPHLSEVELAGAYAAARVLALPSWNEVVSLSSLNAAVSEASLVLSRNGYEHEYFRDDAEFCDPGSVKSIRAAVERAWHAHDARSRRRRLLGARVRNEYTWDKAAEATERAYRRFLAYNPRGDRRLRRTALSA